MNSRQPVPQQRPTRRFAAAIAAAGLTTLGSAGAASILQPTDAIIAIDLDPGTVNSSYPGGEPPPNATDQDSATKYLNFGGPASGMIVTPASGASTIQSFIITTANDAPGRDPSSYELYGTNDAIASADNSRGDGESWTLIGSGAISLPAERFTPGAAVDVTNSTSYSSYKVLFPALSGDGLFQMADIQLFPSAGGAGAGVLAAGDFAIAIHDPMFQSSYPGAESPAMAIDGVGGTKYLNFGQANSGFIVTPGVGSSVVRSFQITTANDAPERDPSSWELFGTNDAITSGDNTFGDAESWTSIGSGAVDLPADRSTLGPLVQVPNDTEYTSYRMVFTGVRDAGAANSMQIDEIQFFDVIPEPSVAVMLAGAAGLGLACGRRRRA